MSEDIFKGILKREPGLTCLGFENQGNNEQFQINRSALENGFNEFKICCEWIERHRTKIKKRDFKNFNFLRYHYNSYFLAHSIERWAEQNISNGAFIASLLYFGISYKPIYGSPDISVFLALNKTTPYI
jgi:hypothetical protein